MSKVKVLTIRKSQHWASYDIVYEWEDALVSDESFELYYLKNYNYSGITYRIINKLLKHFPVFKYKINNTNDINIIIIMSAEEYRIYPLNNTIPIFLDFSESMVDKIYEATKNIPLYFVTSYYIYEKLQKAGSTNVNYLPLSIPDKYLNYKNNKNIAVIQIGRRNAILHNYMLKYCEINKNVKYVFQVNNNGSLEYESNSGEKLGTCNTRRDYINFLSSAKISLVSTPCVDGAKEGLENNDFFTPRFYESAALNCKMIGRYTDGKEADLIDIKSVCPNVSSYDVFEKYINQYLYENVIEYQNKLKKFAENNATSKRINKMKEAMKQYNFI